MALFGDVLRGVAVERSFQVILLFLFFFILSLYFSFIPCTGVVLIYPTIKPGMAVLLTTFFLVLWLTTSRQEDACVEREHGHVKCSNLSHVPHRISRDVMQL